MSLQLDYTLFVYGLSCIVLVMICATMAQRRSARLPSLWMALFATLHGAYQIMEIMALSLEEKGFAGYLTKPVRQTQLYDCLMMSFGQTRLEESAGNRRIVTRHTISEAKRRRASLLMVQGNETEKKIAVSILDKLGATRK